MADTPDQPQSSTRPRKPPTVGRKAGGKPPKDTPKQKQRPDRLTFEDKQVVDYIRQATRDNVWYYRDRIPVLRECWVHGVIDEHTLVWGQGLMDWLPVRNVRTLVPQIRTLEVQMATWIKREVSIKPALAQIRKGRAEYRTHESTQAEGMR